MFARRHHSQNSPDTEIENQLPEFSLEIQQQNLPKQTTVRMNGTSGSLRKLPPMSPRREKEEEDVYATVRKSRKKKRTVPEERDTETNPGMSSPSLTDTHTDRSRNSRRSDRHISRSREGLTESQQPDSTPQHKKRKKKEPTSDLSPRRTLPRKVSAGGETELDGSALSVRGSRRKLTFSSGTNGSLQNKSENEVTQNGTSKPKTTTTSKKKKAKKRKIKAHDGPVGLAVELTGLQEDVVLSRSNGDPVEGISLSAAYMKSTPSDKLFMEHPGGFTSSKKIQVQKRRMQLAAVDNEPTNQLADRPTQTTISFALGSHHIFMTLTLFCQGLFAGVALWHIITVQYMVNISYDNLLTQYTQLAKPLESFYYLLFALCTVAAFDRYDVHRPNRECVFLGLTMQSGALSTACYLIGLIIHLATTKMDDQISLSSSHPDLWSDMNARDKTLKIWWILSMLRGLTAILGWVFSVISPQVDRLRATLENCEENVMAEERGYSNMAFTDGV